MVLEPRAEVSHLRPRAKTTSVRTMEHLRRWGIADALRAAAPLPVAWSQRVTFCESLSGRRITDFDNAFGKEPPICAAFECVCACRLSGAERSDLQLAAGGSGHGAEFIRGASRI